MGNGIAEAATVTRRIYGTVMNKKGVTNKRIKLSPMQDSLKIKLFKCNSNPKRMMEIRKGCKQMKLKKKGMTFTRPLVNHDPYKHIR